MPSLGIQYQTDEQLHQYVRVATYFNDICHQIQYVNPPRTILMTPPPTPSRKRDQKERPKHKSRAEQKIEKRERKRRKREVRRQKQRSKYEKKSKAHKQEERITGRVELGVRDQNRAGSAEATRPGAANRTWHFNPRNHERDQAAEVRAEVNYRERPCTSPPKVGLASLPVFHPHIRLEHKRISHIGSTSSYIDCNRSPTNMDFNNSTINRINDMVDVRTPRKAVISNTCSITVPNHRSHYIGNDSEGNEQEVYLSMTLHLRYNNNELDSDSNTGEGWVESLPTSSPRSHDSDPNNMDINGQGPDDFVLPEACASPDAIDALNSAFEFFLGLQQEQVELCSKSHDLEAQMNSARNKVFKLEASDHLRIKAYEEMLTLTSGLCHDLFIAEYAFRDLLAENSRAFGFDLRRELGNKMEDVGLLVNGYDQSIARVQLCLGMEGK